MNKAEIHNPLVEPSELLSEAELDQFNSPAFRDMMRDRAEQSHNAESLLTLEELKQHLAKDLSTD